jgi:hypothetical protein
LKRLIALLVSFAARNLFKGKRRKNTPDRVAPRRYIPFSFSGVRKTTPKPSTKLAMRATKIMTIETLDP